jgi:hypothetical protein
MKAAPRFKPVHRENAHRGWRHFPRHANNPECHRFPLDKIAEHIATSLVIELEDFQAGWFAQRGSLGRAHELFGDRFGILLEELNHQLAA